MVANPSSEECSLFIRPWNEHSSTLIFSILVFRMRVLLGFLILSSITAAIVGNKVQKEDRKAEAESANFDPNPILGMLSSLYCIF